MNPSSKTPLTIPAFIAKKTDSVDGTLEIKQTLTVVFTEFFTSDVYLATLPPQREEVAALFRDLNTLIDRIYLEQILHKAEQAGSIVQDNRSVY